MSLFSFVSTPPPPPPVTITLDRTNPRYQAVSELDIFKVRGKEYQRVSSNTARVSGNEERKARSFAYKVGEKLVRQSDGKEVTVAICVSVSGASKSYPSSMTPRQRLLTCAKSMDLTRPATRLLSCENLAKQPCQQSTLLLPPTITSSSSAC
ncbi:hypothetical protein LTR17_023630 [Elasticomyces elasticus]|nr:hypothetical protein LTR17_023630 [Elasticomyces elasticus]